MQIYTRSTQFSKQSFQQAAILGFQFTYVTVVQLVFFIV